VAGRNTRSGAALLANDMHLGLGIPNTWYRVRLRVQGSGDATRPGGVTLPGVPIMVVGSNGRIAWGFHEQLWRLERPGACRALGRRQQLSQCIRLETDRTQHRDRGLEFWLLACTVTIESTEWGPILPDAAELGPETRGNVCTRVDGA
jgi:penicillin amidase